MADGAEDLGRSVLELATDSDKFFSDLDKAEKRVAGLRKTMGDSSKELSQQDKAYAQLRDRLSGVGQGADNAKKSTSGLADQLRGLVPTVTVASVGLLVKQWTDAAGAVNDLSERLGVNTTYVQRWKYAAEQTGSSIDAVGTSVSHLQKNVAEGGDKVTEDFERIGLSITEVRKLDPAEMFEQTAEAIKNIPDPIERTRVAMDLFGKGGAEILPMINEGVKELGDQAQRTGNVMSASMVKAGDDLGDSWNTLLGAGKNLVGSVFTPIVPLLTSIAGGLSTVAGWVGVVTGKIGEWTSAGWKETLDDWNTALELLGVRAAALPAATGPAAAGVDALFKPRDTSDLSGALASARADFDEYAANAKKAHEDAARAAEQAAKRQIDAANALNDSQRRTIDTMRQAGIVTAATVADGLAPLIEKLNLAAAADDETGGKTHNLQLELQALWPEFFKLRDAMQAAGMDTSALDQILDSFNQRAGITLQTVQALEAAIPTKPLTDVVGVMQTYDVAAEQNTASTGVLTDAFKTLGLTSHEELQKIADDAKQAYEVIAQQLGKTSPDAIAAFKKWQAAAEAAAGGAKKSWSDAFPEIAGTIRQIGGAISGEFDSMLLGAKGFKEGFLGIWRDLKAGVGKILTEILQDFEGRFLKGLLNMLTGAQGGFLGAFRGLFGGGGLGLGSLFGGGAGAAAGLGTPVAGGAAGTWAGTGGAGGAGIGAGVSGILGGVGAAGAGFGLGALGQRFFGRGLGSASFGGLSGFGTGALIGSIVPGIGTIVGGIIGGLSGVLGGLINFGPSKKELAARAGVKGFQDETFANLTDAQRKEAQGAVASGAWTDPTAAGTLIAVRDAYLAIGKSSQDAERDVKALWDAEKKGPEATQAAMQPLLEALNQQQQKEADAAAATQEHQNAIAEVLNLTKAKIEELGPVGQEATGKILKNLTELADQGHFTADDIKTAIGDGLEAIGPQGVALKNLLLEQWTEISDKGQIAVGDIGDAFMDLPADAAAAGRAAVSNIENQFSRLDFPELRLPVKLVPDGSGYGYASPMPAMPVHPMASGTEGWMRVARPTLFLVGERGPEDMNITGAGQGGGASMDYDALAAAVKAGVHAALSATGLSSLGSGAGLRDAADRFMPEYVPDMVARFGGTRRRLQNAIGVTG